MLIKLCPPMQSPKSPVKRAGCVVASGTPSGCTCARTEGIKVPVTAREKRNAVAHVVEAEGKRAIVVLIYRGREREKERRGRPWAYFPNAAGEGYNCQMLCPVSRGC